MSASKALPPAAVNVDHYDLTKGSPAVAGGNPYLPFFGAPQYGTVATNPRDAYSVTNYDLPKFYEGRNEFLAQTIDSLVMRVDSWPTGRVLPWHQTDNLSFTWNTFRFDNHLTGRTPEEGTSRLVKVNYSENSDYAERHGLAMILEHGFFLTPLGRMHFVMNILQIKAAALETVNYSVIAALLYSKFYSQEWYKRHGAASAHDEVERIIEDEVENWAIVNRQENGLQQMYHRMRDRMKPHVLPDTWIFPSRLKMFVTTVGERHWRYDAGGPAHYRDGDLGPDKAPVFPEDDIAIFEASLYKVFDRRAAIDLLRYQRTIGEFFVMADVYRGRDLRAYESAWRDIMVHSGDEDIFRRISLKQALGASMRFKTHTQGGGLSDHHKRLIDYMRDEMSESEALPDARDLMLWTPDGRARGKSYYPVAYLGQMDRAFLSDEALRSAAESGYAALGLDAETVADIQRAQALLRDIDNQAYDAAYWNGVKASVSGKRNGIDAEANAHGTLDLPEKTAGALYPAGYANYPGLVELARNGEIKGWGAPLVARAQQALDTFNTVYNAYERLFPDNALASVQHQDPWFAVPDQRTAFFAHVFYVSSMPFWVQAGARSAERAGLLMAGAPISGDAFKTEIKQQRVREALASALVVAQPDNADALFEHLKRVDATKRTQYATNVAEALARMGPQRAHAFIEQLVAKNKIEPEEVAAVAESADVANVKDARVALDANAWVRTPLTVGGAMARKESAFYTSGVTLSDLSDPHFTTPLAPPASQAGQAGRMRIVNERTFTLADSRVIAATGWARALAPEARASKRVRADASADAEDEDEAVYGAARRRVAGGAAAARRGTSSLDDAAEAIAAAASSSRVAFRTSTASARCLDDLGDVMGRDDDRLRGARRSAMGSELAGWQNVINANLAARWQVAAADTDPVRRMTALMYLGARNTLAQWEAFIDGNLVFLANFLLLRPFQRYWMKSAILLKTGMTAIGHSDMMLADNAVQKLHYGHFTFYFRPIVKRPENIAIAKDLLADGVIGGDGVRFFTSPEQYDRANAIYGADIFSCMIGYEERELGTRLDITGRYDTAFLKDIELMQSVSEDGRVQGRKLHYSSALYYRTLWRFAPMPAPNQVEYFVNETRIENTICFWGHQQMYDIRTQSFSNVHRNQGHWGATIYEGARSVRNGRDKLFVAEHLQRDVTMRY